MNAPDEDVIAMDAAAEVLALMFPDLPFHSTQLMVKIQAIIGEAIEKGIVPWRTPFCVKCGGTEVCDQRSIGRPAMSKFKFLREMPSSLNDACRSMEAAADEIDRLHKAAIVPNSYQLLEIARKVQPYLAHSYTFSNEELLCYFAGFNLSQFARLLLAE